MLAVLSGKSLNTSQTSAILSAQVVQQLAGEAISHQQDQSTLWTPCCSPEQESASFARLRKWS